MQDGGDGPVALSLRRRRRKEQSARIKEQCSDTREGRGGEESGEEGEESTYGAAGIEEGEAAGAAGGAEAGVDGGVAVEVRAAAELLLVHLPRPHAGGRFGNRSPERCLGGGTWTGELRAGLSDSAWSFVISRWIGLCTTPARRACDLPFVGRADLRRLLDSLADN